jgi:hypothetical protein
MLPERIKKKAKAKVVLIEDGMTMDVDTIYAGDWNETDTATGKGVLNKNLKN